MPLLNVALPRPPSRLRALPEGRARFLRLFWGLLFVFAVTVVVLATSYSLRATYVYGPAFTELGLDFDVVDDGVMVGRLPEPGQPAPPVDGRLLAINGQAVAPDMTFGQVVDRLTAAGGKSVALTVRQPNGRTTVLQQQRRPVQSSAEAQRDANLRIATRLGFALFACAVLLLCSLLLALRRPQDPIAMLFALVFAFMAASVDPPVQLWLWTRLGWVEELLSSTFFYLLLVALAAFPDGVFVPRFLRWIWLGALPLVLFAALPGVNGVVQVLSATGALLALLAGQITRYRRLPAGIERQQIKWAAFGFAAGFVVLSISFSMLAFIPDDPSKQVPLFNTLTLVLFSLGSALIPLGLLIALTRFRLWEADTIITRSAAYAVVTVIVGVVWAASSDLVKLLITEVMGRESEAGATTVGAIIAAGIFSPTQSAVLGWTRRHFGSPLERVRGSAERLKNWGLTEAPAEVATRALGIIDEAVHPLAAAVVLNTSDGEQTIATRGQEVALRHKLVEHIDLSDEEGSVGKLLLGRRSDGNRYNRQELEAVRELVPHIADALRVARGRHSRESMLQQQIEAMAARLSQLEGGSPRPA